MLGGRQCFLGFVPAAFPSAGAINEPRCKHGKKLIISNWILGRDHLRYVFLVGRVPIQVRQPVDEGEVVIRLFPEERKIVLSLFYGQVFQILYLRTSINQKSWPYS
jgi:hypothetical protein